ncbi:MAG: prepilin peptidase [Lachnospiraceae bacterium]|nr:prepilin peptidase [Lachnospiraceae bacterium]
MRHELAVLFLFLIGCALYDVKEKRISLLYTGAFAAMGIYMSVNAGREPLSVLCAAAPGAALMAVSLITGGAIGFGDGIAVAAAGTFIDAESVLVMCCLGFLFAAAGAGAAFIIRRRGQDELPFMPFLLAGCAAGAFLYGL